MNSLIIPVYKNEESMPSLLDAVKRLASKRDAKLEVVFVIDGSPDNCYNILVNELAHYSSHFQSKLVTLSRNFGAFSAVRAGLASASGDYFAVMAADLQEPIELIDSFFKILSKNEIDITLGKRTTRNDPGLGKLFSKIYWNLYRKFIIKDIPKGGVDIFGCNTSVRDQILALEESHSSLVGLLFWVGFNREYVEYTRLPRHHGKSAWSFSSKLSYLSNSIFAFSSLPIRAIMILGEFAIVLAVLLGILTLYARLVNHIVVPGYASILLVIIFFSGINLFCTGLIGSYVWRIYENTKSRPQYIIRSVEEFK